MTTATSPAEDRMLTAGRDWRQRAACLPADPDLFFPVSAAGRSLEQVTRAKTICARCRVRGECLAFALATGQVHGVWGGLTEQERRPLGSSAWSKA
jgi:WhiB family transcriptional regulator, redox-sensing transcriptional regulator